MRGSLPLFCRGLGAVPAEAESGVLSVEMLRSLVGSEMCIRDSAAAEYLILDLFAGMDGLGHALESLGVRDFPSLHLSLIHI